VHTVELARFLAKGGFDVRHIYARYPSWGIGGVSGEPPLKSEVLDFDEASWNVPAIQARFRAAVDAWAPDYVILTDSWNMKPILAEAVRGYPYIMRLQAMECLCPLNNLRLLPESGVRGEGSGDRGPRVRQCPLNQLANPGECRRCVAENGRWSGDLHQLARGLAGVESALYHERLVRAMGEAEAVLVVNPLTAELVKPFARDVPVVTAGIDPGRFAEGREKRGAGRGKNGERERVSILFAGLVHEPSKGFHVLQQACALLWQRRRDFELAATADPAGPAGPFTRFLRWLSQDDLPARLYEADIVVLPAIGQEALGRTAVEAMAAGRAVVASRIGGLPVTVADGVTGLLCEPGSAVDLADKIERLLDDSALRERLGKAGRKRFEEEYSWDVIIERHYRPLLRVRSQ